MPRMSILQVFSDWSSDRFPEQTDVPAAFYPEESEGTWLNQLIGNSNLIALNRINKI